MPISAFLPQNGHGFNSLFIIFFLLCPISSAHKTNIRTLRLEKIISFRSWFFPPVKNTHKLFADRAALLFRLGQNRTAPVLYPSVPVEYLTPLIVFFKLSFKLLLLMKKFVLRYQLHTKRTDQSYQRQQITALAYVKIVYVIAVFLCSVRKHFYFRFIFPHVYNTTHPLFLTIQLCKRSLYNN